MISLMSEIQGPPPAEAPKQPHIDIVKFNGSEAHIYDADDLFLQAQTEGIGVHDRADFASPIERARLNLEPVETNEGEPAVGISGDIQLVRSLIDMKSLAKKFTSTYKPHNGVVRGGLTVSDTIFTNCWVVVDDETGVKMMVSVYDDGQIRLSNQRVASNANDENQKTEIHAPAAHTVDATEQLRGASRIFMHTLDAANGVNHHSVNVPLKRTYAIGESIRPIGYNTAVTRTLGQQSVKRVVSSPRPTPGGNGETVNQSDLEQELGVSIGSGEIMLDDVGGLHGVKAKLRDIAVSFTHPEVMEKWGAERPQGVILYGEPGTGKTMLVEALANEIGADLWAIQGSDIYNMWLGNSEAKIKELFTKAKGLTAPTVVQFDEFDSIIGTNDEPGPGGAGAARNGVAGIFKQEMNTLAKENPNVLVVATTNHLDRIDAALVRSGRFDHKIYVPMPDNEARTEIVSGIISKAIITQEDTEFKPYADELDIPEVTRQTDGMSGADISEIFRRINLKKAMEEARTGSAEPISQDDIDAAIREFRTQG